MKHLFLLCLGLFTMQQMGWCQGCFNQIVQSSVVNKPSDAGVIAASCSTLVIKWKGFVDQTYVINSTFTDPHTQLTAATDRAMNITGDDELNYTATIPVKPGMRVRFDIIAMSVIDNRTFTSYPLRNDEEYIIPDCGEVMVNAGASERKGQISSENTSTKKKEELLLTNRELQMYPNPVSDVLNIRWNGEYTGQAKISVLDISGKMVKSLDIKKQQTGYTNALTVNTLQPGTYLLYIKMANGKSLVTKFLKN